MMTNSEIQTLMRHLNNLEENGKALEQKANMLEEKLKELENNFDLDDIENILVSNHTKAAMIQLNRISILEKSEKDFQSISISLDKKLKTLTIKLS
jgi:predicted nuclease with TOPRIM domain